MDKNLRPYLAELLGTFFLVFVSAGAVCINQLAIVPRFTEQAVTVGGQNVIVQSPLGVIGIALAEGLTLAVALAATVHFSGGYLNPAVTLMLWVFKRLDGAKTAWLIFVQMLGAAIAGGLIRALFAFQEVVMRDSHLGTPHINLFAFGYSFGSGLEGHIPTRALFSGIGLEVILTFFLTFAIFGTMIDPRAPRLLGPVGKWLSSLWVGLTMAVIVLVGFNYTGAAANPARWFGTVLWELTVPSLQLQHPLADHLVYWIGPIVGSLVAGGIYCTLILPGEEERTTTHGTTSTTGSKVGSGSASTLFRAKK